MIDWPWHILTPVLSIGMFYLGFVIGVGLSRNDP